LKEIPVCDYPNARRLVVYHDGFDDLRAWMEELHIEEDVSDPPGALMPLLESVEMGTLTDRIGPDRMEAFVTKLRQEEIELLRRAARLGRHGGLKYENVAMLEQAHRHEAEADAAEERLQELHREWPGAPPAPDDTDE
jgi:hypothetical protein